jgi:hypothetical protein
MNKVKSNRRTALIIATVAIAFLFVGIYGLTRPISYGLNYYHATFYEGEDFSGTMTFYSDNTMFVRNTTLGDDTKFLYYHKNGYVFLLLSETQEEYENEVAAIDEDFEGAVNSPFYASKINAFRCVSEGPDGYRSVYLCQSSLLMALLWGAIELILICFAFSYAVRYKKEKRKAQS